MIADAGVRTRKPSQDRIRLTGAQMVFTDNVKSELRTIDAARQAVTVRRANFTRPNFDKAFDRFFGAQQDEIRVSRSDVAALFGRKDVTNGLLLTFMWGFPTGGRGSMGKSLIKNLEALSEQIAEAMKEGLRPDLFEAINSHAGINYATTTKFMYFAGVCIGGVRCLIFDARVRKFLQVRRPSEFQRTLDAIESTQGYKLTFRAYSAYVNDARALAEKMDCSADAIELLMFRDAPGYRAPIHT